MGGQVPFQVKTRSAALKRRYGALPDTVDRVKLNDASFDDWRGRCRHCGEDLEGTLAELREHNCG